MSLLSSISIQNRLYLMVGWAALFMLIIGVLGVYNLGASNNAIHALFSNAMNHTKRLSEIEHGLEESRAQVLLGLQHDPSSPFATMHDHALAMHVGRVRERLAHTKAQWAEIAGSELGSEERVHASAFEKAWTQLVAEGFEPMLKAITAEDFHRANEILLQKINPHLEEALKSANALLELQQREGEQSYREANARYDQELWMTIVLLLIAFASSGLLAFLTVAGIRRAVTSLDHGAVEMSKGNLSVAIDYQGSCEFGRIADAIRGMQKRFAAVIADISDAAERLATAANETLTVSRRTTEEIHRQQTETDMVATAMNEMNATVHEVSRSAAQAAEAAQGADRSSSRGKQIVDQTVDAIGRLAGEVERAADVIGSLERESENIGTVLDVIKNIAEQTNLLALNAAIEAARAGEQGRGFAVVADEVRTLASRTQQSTQEIEEMIERLQSGARNAVQVMESGKAEAANGVTQANEAGAALAEITAAVDRINEMNTQIASASEEQSSVAEEINRNIVNISEIAGSTATGSQQAAVASEELSQLAQRLQTQVATFRL